MASLIPPQPRESGQPTLLIATIVRDGMRFLPKQLEVFKQLSIPWHWSIAEGTADSVLDTAWVKTPKPGLSTDGTTEWLAALNHPKVSHVSKPLWKGKTEQINACLAMMPVSGCLLQCDADEFWTAKQLEKIVQLFQENRHIGQMRFYCNYFVGPDIVTAGTNAYGNKINEWTRAWRWKKGVDFRTHEPPSIRFDGSTMTRDQTLQHGLVFNHFAYAYPEQVEFKERYYGYQGALDQWKKLQENKVWPVEDLSKFLPWVGAGCRAVKI